MLRFAILLIFGLIPLAGYCQKTIALSFAGQYTERQDLTLSPAIYRGFSLLNGGIYFQNNKPRTVQEINIQVGMVSLKAHSPFSYVEPIEGKTVETYPSRLFSMELRYAFLHRFSDKKTSNWAIGGLLDNQIIGHFQEYGFGSALGYTTVSALSLVGQWQKSLGQKTQLTVKAFTPIVAWVARSPFALNDDVFIENIQSHRPLKTVVNFILDGSIQLPTAFQKFNTHLNLSHKIGNRWRMVLFDEVEIVRTKQPRPLNTWRNQLGVGLVWQL